MHTNNSPNDDSVRFLIRRVGDAGPWLAPRSSAYNDEDQLEELVADSPHWVPGVQEGAFSVRQFYTSAGPVDVLIVGSDGSVTAVECKLDANPEKRRTVIGQLIDYVSAIREGGFDRFIEKWRQAKGGNDLSSVLDPDALDELRKRIETSTIALCWVADRLDDDLRRLIKYFNEVTEDRIAVTALQLEYAKLGEEFEILIPSTYGGEIADAKASRTGETSEYWTRAKFVEAVAALADPADDQFLTRLLELQEENNKKPILGAKTPLSFEKKGVFFRAYGLNYPPFKLAIERGRLAISGCWTGFPGVTRHPGFAGLAALLRMEISGPASYVPVGELGTTADELWPIAETTALAVNDQNE
jgi:hypothetical protein